jgi:class 3 adenylate cyclase
LEAAAIVGAIAAGVAILGAAVALTRYFTHLQVGPGIEKLAARNAEVESQYRELREEVAVAKRIGFAALIKKEEIDDDLLDLMRLTDAEAGSILVPSPSLSSRSRPEQLVFLSIYGPTAQALKRVRVPIDGSIAGDVFKRGSYDVARNAKADRRHFDAADRVSAYRTEQIVTYPLVYQDKNVGVVQLLNKTGGGKFTAADVSLLESVIPSLAARVADFIGSPENFDILRISPEREAEEATVLFCDLTNSSRLFQSMTTPIAIDLINEYLEQTCEIAMQLKGTIDQCLGDGAMIRFNVPRRVTDATSTALVCALRIQEQFAVLKERWLRAGYPVHEVYSRVAIASGPVHRAVLGHPQHEHSTIMGEPVNASANLCEAAARDRNIIVMDSRSRDRLGLEIECNEVPADRLGKAARYTRSAFEVLGRRGNAQDLALPDRQ